VPFKQTDGSFLVSFCVSEQSKIGNNRYKNTLFTPASQCVQFYCTH
jgi:hypothetical protein